MIVPSSGTSPLDKYSVALAGLDRSRKLLRETAAQAVRSASKIAPLRCKLPVTIELDLSSDARKDPALGARFDDNVRFTDGP